ncbi:3-ketoacyl-CoA thiolase B, peroxisomal-like [Lytechinus pictus]|uniref:3-ketoacyl-CoA thiolase B, peroxisomal-like n=1 Tax=Lytechinus pictus TaxID=7653 RepID=UPI0030BA03E8
MSNSHVKEPSMHRMNAILSHLSRGIQHGSSAAGTTARLHSCTPALAAAGVTSQRRAVAERRKNADDVVVCSALRTPIGKAKKGSFKDTHADDLLAAAFKGVLDETKISPDRLGDIVVGNVLLPGGGAIHARFAQFYSGIPESVPVNTVNRQCSSGLQAFMNAAGGIKSGVYDVALAGGVESMTRSQMYQGEDLNPRVMLDQTTQDCLIPMGITSENVAEKFGISRQEQDQMALDSQLKAAAAQKNGYFDREIIPVSTIILDEAGQERPITVTKDDGVRGNTTIEGLAKLKPAFSPEGTTTAGNSSQVSDGAAAVLVASRQAAESLNLPVMGVLVSYAVVGVPPSIMGIGPAYAIPEALKKAGLTTDDIEIFEINEAFASQATYCVQNLGIPMEKVNPNGGAIALGHPLGCTGARQIGTLLHELDRRGNRAYGVVSMCIGTGMGAAAVFYYPGK